MSIDYQKTSFIKEKNLWNPNWLSRSASIGLDF